MKLKGYNRIRLYAYPLYAVFMYLLFILINPLDEFLRSYEGYGFWDYVYDVVSVILFTVIILESGILITKLLNRFMPWEISSVRRVVLQLLLQVTTLIFLFALVFYLFPPEPVSVQYAFDYDLILRQAIVLGTLVSLLNTAIFTAEHFFKEWLSTKIEGIQLKQNITQARLDALTAQIDPHFLFNNLSTLTSLIEIDQDSAVDFVLRFTQVYRYMLSQRQSAMIPLMEEMKFIESYLYLYRMRFGEALVLEACIPDHLKDREVAPMSLQLLVENAVKHNEISWERPLHITICTEGEEWLVVSNNRAPRRLIEASTRLGLRNIVDRYQLLGKLTPQIIQEAETFTVKLPI